MISIFVTNNTGTPLAISAATLATPLFVEPSAWFPGPAGSSSLRPSATIALPASLAAAHCDESSDPAPPVDTRTQETANVLLTINGRQQEFQAADPHSVLRRLQQEDCLQQAVADIAILDLRPALTVAADGRSAVVHLTITPKGIRENMLLSGFGNTTLLAENPQRPWPRNISVTGTDVPTTVDLAVIPARCDPHALAEDKAGTKLPVDVTTKRHSGQLRLEPPTDFTRSVYAFVSAACGN